MPYLEAVSGDRGEGKVTPHGKSRMDGAVRVICTSLTATVSWMDFKTTENGVVHNKPGGTGYTASRMRL
jgi:hypothetical protein